MDGPNPGERSDVAPESAREFSDWEFDGLAAAMLTQCFVSAAAVGSCWWLRYLHPLAMHLPVGAFAALSCGWVWLMNRRREWPGHPLYHGKEIPTPRRALALTAWQAAVTTLWWLIYSVHIPALTWS